VGDPNDREIDKLRPLVEEINLLEPNTEQRIDALQTGQQTGEEPFARVLTDEYRARIRAGETLDDILPDAFAAVREIAKRTVDMRPFDVQLIGGIILHKGIVAEMRTGEGKTLVATMPVYLNALTGRGVHLVTVNDYLARRDALWMGPVYHSLGLGLGLLQSGRDQPAYVYDPSYQRDPYPGLRPVPRTIAYAADITYGTNNEFGFDYLRDNLALTLERRVQRPLYFAIVDEVDNIFIDEARTPLIISGPSGESVEDYGRFAAIARRLEPDVHFELDEKERSVYLTDEGLAVVEQETGIENIYDEANYRYVHYMQQALKANALFLEGRDYIRQRKRIILIDQHTGRLMPSRRLSEGLHQAIEAKENVQVRPRDVTSATVTIQNYFRMYEKLAGMSGTAVTEGEEFFKIYELEVLVVPTNRPVVRDDSADVVYRSEEAKLRAAARELLACHSRGQPVLVGTTSVEMSERLSTRLTAERLQMAGMAPRAAYALQDADMDRDERAGLRETMNSSLETMNSLAWRRMLRALELDPNALAPENLDWLARYLELPNKPGARGAMERALREGIEHHVLNAKEHTREAGIIARAGLPGAVTIATNMAGRGVDIKLGGDLSDEVVHRAHQALQARALDSYSATRAQMDTAIAEVAPQYAQRRERVVEAGGLHVLGTERHEARRIDNQLRGRSGRQGEPGSSRFFLSLEDDLMRRFGRRDMLGKLMEQIGDDFPIEHNLVSRTIERAQTSVEGHNFDIRKHLLEYDDVLNRQRESIYEERLHILQSDDLRAEVWRMLEGQVDEYLERYGEEPDQLRLLFAGMDDVVPLNLPAPKAPFQGPLAFTSHLTAFPPFTIGYLADQLADQPMDAVQRALRDLPHQAAASYGDFTRQTISDIATNTEERYEERLERYQELLDEKIEDYLQLSEERGLPSDAKRLAQHLERTYPLRLTTPRLAEALDLDDLRDGWLSQVEVEFHRQTCAGLMERIQVRLPADVRLDRLRPARMAPHRLADELSRVLNLAARNARSDGDRDLLLAVSLPDDASSEQVDAVISTIKEHTDLDFGRLDRLVGHVLGSNLNDLLARYEAATDAEDNRLLRDLDRLRGSVTEGRKGGRVDVLDLFGQLNNMVHLEIADIVAALSRVSAHEYDKWAQKQLSDVDSDSARNPLADTTWASVAEHLLSTHYTQKQVYDREHRRRTTWTPRLPLSLIGQAHAEGQEPLALREGIMDSLRWAVQQREETWGLQELERWGSLSLDELDEDIYAGLTRFLGTNDLGDRLELRVDDLPTELYESLRFVLALRQREGRLLSDLPEAESLLRELGRSWEAQVLGTTVGELGEEYRDLVLDQVRTTGRLDDPAARKRLEEQAIQSWDRRTRDQVASYLGQRVIDAEAELAIRDLDDDALQVIDAYLKRQQYFVDEERVQEFLIRQRLTDLPPETTRAALRELAQSRLDRLSRRKIANLDISTRSAVIESLQRLGLFTDEGRRELFLEGSLSLAELDPELRAGFQAFVARRELEPDESLSDLGDSAQSHVLRTLKAAGLLDDANLVEALPDQKLGELTFTIEGESTEALRDELVGLLADKLRADLAAKTMEELPAGTRDRVHRALDERNYFVDEEKVTWYERKNLAQLPAELMRDLEQHLGAIQMAELGTIPFRELPSDVQESVLGLLDGERLLADRAERLRLTQTGSLETLSDHVQDEVARHLGRRWLVEIRGMRPPMLPETDREAVWAYLRDQGYFVDEFKEELFAFQRMNEFDSETQLAVEESLIRQLQLELDAQPIGLLPADMQANVELRLRRMDYLVSESRLQEVESTPVSKLPPEHRTAVETALGEHLLAGLGETPLPQLPEETRTAFWLYLDEIGFFVDDTKRAKIVDRPLSDLTSEDLQAVSDDLAAQIGEEISDSLVSDLSDDLRKDLREALAALGYFESSAEREQVMSQPLGTLRRDDLAAIATELGRAQIVAWGQQRLADLPGDLRADILSTLQSHDWFLDRKRLATINSQPLGTVAADFGPELMASLRQRHQDILSQKRLSDLAREERLLAHEYLLNAGLDPDEEEMQPLLREPVSQLEPELRRAYLESLGSQVVAKWGATRIQDMTSEQRVALQAYFGRQIMGRIERRVLLHTISRLWIDYLTDIEDLRRGIGLEAYAQRDPLVEYKRKAFELFEDLGNNIRRTVVRSLFRQPPEPLRSQ
jgi:preprotein translocase subunit SecA